MIHDIERGFFFIKKKSFFNSGQIYMKNLESAEQKEFNRKNPSMGILSTKMTITRKIKIAKIGNFFLYFQPIADLSCKFEKFQRKKKCNFE